MNINYDQLRLIAQKVTEIPPHFQLEMEDSTPVDKPIVRSFVWQDPNDEERTIELSLSLETGELADLRVSLDADERIGGSRGNSGEEIQPELEKVDQKTLWPSDEKIRQVADDFVRHYALNFASFTAVSMAKGRKNTHIIYQQKVGGLPVPGSGCEVALNSELKVVSFNRDNGRVQELSPLPVWPEAVVDAEQVRRKVLDELKMELKLVSLYPSMYDIQETEQHWAIVYEPSPTHRSIMAVTGEDRFSKEHYIIKSRPLTRVQCSRGAEQMIAQGGEIAYWEQRLGIDMNLHTLYKMKEDEESISAVYMQIKQKEESEPKHEFLSVDGYMDRKWGEQLRNLKASYMLKIEKTTGRLLRYNHSTQSAGEAGKDEGRNPMAKLNREQCWRVAEQFLAEIFPDYDRYLQLQEDLKEEEEDTGEQDRQFFYLPLHINGVPVGHEQVTISVLSTTGEIGVYMGVSYETVQELEKSDLRAAISEEEALALFSKHVHMELEWVEDRQSEPEAYRLVYRMATGSASETKRLGRADDLRYIDAATGRLIRNKPLIYS